MALDAKINFDDNAAVPPQGVAGLRDPTRKTRRARGQEAGTCLRRARRQHRLPGQRRRPGDGHDGHHQALRRQPANFLDVGGGATEEQVTRPSRSSCSDPAVKGIFVNIFGGIMKCDVIATGVITAAAKELGLKVPLVVRLEGTNVELGKKMLARAASHRPRRRPWLDGAQKIVKAPRKSAAAPEGHEPWHPRRQEHPRRGPGHHRLGRLVPRQADARVRHQGRRRRHPGQGRREVRSGARSSTPWPTP
jgi:succinyl-CoA synthetase beta subunit